MGKQRKKISSALQYSSSSDMGIFGNYERWIEAYSAYAALRKEKKSSANARRLKKLRKQIIIQYFKNFFYFPLWIVRFFKPAYMKGPVTAWDNIKTLTRLFVSGEFRPLRHAILSQIFFLIALSYFGLVTMRRYAVPVYAATYGWAMTDWSGGVSTTAYGTHASNQTGWNYIYSKDASINTSIPGQIALTLSLTTSTDTTDADFTTSTRTNVFIPTSTNSFRLKKQNGGTCTTAAECAGGGCSANRCYTAP
ncbi:MAG TPA: hypothetical protein PK295_02210 [Candidatus Magasanikbacteria bacterium]|nr:hypothetical protein [Candidatus Magasanikbacteria bacterium]